MAAAGLLPQPDYEPDAAGEFLTFVVPMSSGCNLRCPFGLVRERKEIIRREACRENDTRRFLRREWDRPALFETVRRKANCGAEELRKAASKDISRTSQVFQREGVGTLFS